MTYLFPPPTGFTKTGCRVTNSAGQSIPTGALTALAFDTDTFDFGAMHDPAVNNTRITIPAGEDGIYVCGANAHFDATAAVSIRSLGIRLNGANFICDNLVRAPVVAVGDFSLITCCTWEFVAGDFIEAWVFQNTLGALNVSSDPDSSPVFWAQRLSD